MKKRGAIQRTSQTVEKLCFSTRKGSLREIPSKLKYAKNQNEGFALKGHREMRRSQISRKRKSNGAALSF